MNVQNIIYERAKGGEHNRQSCRIEIKLGEGMDPDIALNWAIDRAHADLGLDADTLRQGVQHLAREKRDLEIELENIKLLLEKARVRWEKVKAFFDERNIPLPNTDEDCFPF